MTLTAFHSAFEDGVRWRLVTAGVEIEGGGVERTRGAPSTVSRVWETYAEAINRTARAWRVPCELIVATICTESGGRSDAVRLEPGYVSDEKTPGKVSPGLMQTLISTAREALQLSLDRAWLLQAANSIQAGTAYIAQQAKTTGFDPPLVAAAYNAGKLAHQGGTANRWKLRQYPLGTGAHCDRFVRFFNDAIFVLSRHAIAPAVGMQALLAGEPALPARSMAGSTPVSVAVAFGPEANAAALTPYSRAVQVDILRNAGLTAATVSSTSRTPADQARVMFENLERHGVDNQKRLYGAAGDKVIDVYVTGRGAGKTSEAIQVEMERRIMQLGPTSVSRHTADPRVLNVFDVAPSSIRDRSAFERAARNDSRVAKFLSPADMDPAYHLEIPQIGRG
jgi:hypothetical protein